MKKGPHYERSFMMIPTQGYAAMRPTSPLMPFRFDRRDPGPQDVVIDILFCGVCHSDIHAARDEWGGAHYPMVPGHEIVGRVTSVGAKVKKIKPGAIAGVGCFVDSCRTCEQCRQGHEQYCSQAVFTYNHYEKNGKTLTYGGYSNKIVVDEKFVLKIAPDLPLERVAPLLCAGITTYSPLRHWKVSKGQQVGILGLGGLGHMGIKFASAFGAKVTVLSTSKAKESDAREMGADDFIVTTEPGAVEALAGRFDFILDTISAPHDVNAYLEVLKVDGTMVLVGAPPKPLSVEAFSLIMKRRCLAGSLIGGIRETQEMLDYCAKKKILSDVQVIPLSHINAAYERIVKGDVRYRFVIDLKAV